LLPTFALHLLHELTNKQHSRPPDSQAEFPVMLVLLGSI
jgi:hypothetical protein